MATQNTNKPTMLSSYVGFDTIPKQIEHKLRKRGFLFNVMLVDRVRQINVDQYTLRDALDREQNAEEVVYRLPPDHRNLDLDAPDCFLGAPPAHASAVENSCLLTLLVTCGRLFHRIPLVRSVLEENGVQLTLNVIDTPGFGDQVNNDKWSVSRRRTRLILRLLLCIARLVVGSPLWTTFARSMTSTCAKSSSRSATKASKTRVCTAASTSLRPQGMRKLEDMPFSSSVQVFFMFVKSADLAARAYLLKPLDILVLQKLMQIVNVVPVLAKSDALTLEERTAFKRRVRVSYFPKCHG
ncbi:MAG: LOW QUALITY PROTEIN: hypothetical protein BJ554DRAFT_7196, partial [Olpidium bornovanus]